MHAAFDCVKHYGATVVSCEENQAATPIPLRQVLKVLTCAVGET